MQNDVPELKTPSTHQFLSESEMPTIIINSYSPARLRWFSFSENCLERKLNVLHSLHAGHTNTNFPQSEQFSQQ